MSECIGNDFKHSLGLRFETRTVPPQHRSDQKHVGGGAHVTTTWCRFPCTSRHNFGSGVSLESGVCGSNKSIRGQDLTYCVVFIVLLTFSLVVRDVVLTQGRQRAQVEGKDPHVVDVRQSCNRTAKPMGLGLVHTIHARGHQEREIILSEWLWLMIVGPFTVVPALHLFPLVVDSTVLPFSVEAFTCGQVVTTNLIFHVSVVNGQRFPLCKVWLPRIECCSDLYVFPFRAWCASVPLNLSFVCSHCCRYLFFYRWMHFENRSQARYAFILFFTSS